MITNRPSFSRAAVLYGPGRAGVEEFPYPPLLQGGAIIKSIQCGICGTDKHTYLGETKQYAGTDIEYDVPFPIITGHESVGVIEEISPEGARTLEFDGETLTPGDRVVLGPVRPCRTCWWCKNYSWYNFCEGKDRVNYGCSKGCKEPPHLFGANSQYEVVLKGSNLYKIPDELDDDMACLVEPMCVAYSVDKAMELSSFGGEGWSFNCTVVIQGAGPIGICHLIKSRMQGAGKIIITDKSPYRLEIAKSFGADICLNVDETTSQERIGLVKELTHGRGADICFECVGHPEVVNEGIEMLRKGGLYMDPGSFADCGGTPLNMHLLCSKNIRFFGVSDNVATGFKPTIEMMVRFKNQFPWQKLFTHRFHIDDYQEALETSLSPNSMKVLVSPWKYKK